MDPPKRQTAACDEEKDEGCLARMRELRGQAVAMGFLLVDTDCDGDCMFQAKFKPALNTSSRIIYSAFVAVAGAASSNQPRAFS